jgi:hypothetical protein
VDALAENTIQLLNFLLPGFAAAWLFYGLTAHPRKEPFERVVQALIFTFIIKAEVIGIHKAWWVGWHPTHLQAFWTPEKDVVWSLICSLVTGLAFALCANRDWAHSLLRCVGITKRTSYPSEWYSGLHRFKREMILHLKEGRRMRGWADEWPDQPDHGHFLIQNPKWLDDEGKEYPLGQIDRADVHRSIRG